MQPRRIFLPLAAVVVLLPAAACSQDKGETPSSPQAAATATEPPRAITAVVGTPTPEPSPSQTPESPTPTATPAAATPTATPRVENGLQVVDEVWVGIVREAGGLRIRSAPRIQSGNVVGSVAQNAEVQVSGRVLNGEEAETGKGTVWLIVGPNQYIYAAPGYIERLP
ncbi:MAG: hypothetical protein AB7R89_05300 [Dehalococcoidia bacterium]